MHNKKLYLKYLLYFTLALILYFLRTTRGLSISIGGVNLDYFPMFIVAISMFEDGYTGATYGIIVAFMLGISVGGINLGNMVFYPIFALIFGWVMESDFRCHLVSAEIFTLICGLCYCTLSYLAQGVFMGVSFSYFLQSTFIYIPLAMFGGLPVYYIVKQISLRLNEEKI